MSKIKTLLVDDHYIVRNGIKQLINNQDDIEVIGEASNGKEAIEQFKNLSPDVIVMDVGMPEMNGVEALLEMKKQNLSPKVLMLSMFDAEEYVLKAVEYGALGYILKDADESKFLKAIRTVHEGKRYYGHDISGFIIDRYLNFKPEDSVKDQKKKHSFAAELSKRELDILRLIVDGKSNKQIAEQLDISVRTIETHRLNIMKKMQVNNVAEMVRVAIENELI